MCSDPLLSCYPVSLTAFCLSLCLCVSVVNSCFRSQLTSIQRLRIASVVTIAVASSASASASASAAIVARDATGCELRKRSGREQPHFVAVVVEAPHLKHVRRHAHLPGDLHFELAAFLQCGNVLPPLIQEVVGRVRVDGHLHQLHGRCAVCGQLQ